MNIDDLKLGEIKQLKKIFGGCNDAQILKRDLGLNIVILQRGWVMVGFLTQSGTEMRLEKAAVVERWGTTEGIGELAANGPTPNTRLRSCPPTTFHELTVIARIECKEPKWESKL